MLALFPEFFAPVMAMVMAVGVFLTVFSVKRRRDAQRKRAMEAVAGDLNTSYAEKDPYGLAKQLQNFDLLKPRRTGRITNVMRSTVGETEVYLFDYSYVISTGKSSRRISQTVFFANDKKWYLPNFRLKPERWWHKLFSGLGLQSDIDFAESPEFSDKFWLKSEFESLVREKFTPELQQFMLEKPPVNLEGENYYLIAYKRGKLLRPEDAKVFFENCCALTRLMQTEGKRELLELVELKEKVAREG